MILARLQFIPQLSWIIRGTQNVERLQLFTCCGSLIAEGGNVEETKRVEEEGG